MGEPADIVHAAVIEHLRRPEAYPDNPGSVDAIETHFAWVFLSRLFVYKLKKPIRFRAIDFTTLPARRAVCELELSLNRRLAESVYVDVVPLCREDGTLRLEGEGEAVEWLIKMRRLPAERSLESAVTHDRLEPQDLERFVRKLARFYRATPAAPWTAKDYLRVLASQSGEYCAQLQELGDEDDQEAIERLRALQLDFIERSAGPLSRRVEDGRVVDAHGDLRPEHVFLGEDPQIIDCLEFSAELRQLDTAEEISFLDLECGRLGHPELGRKIFELYRAACNDDVDEHLYQFYRSRRCTVRGLVSLWHIEDYPAGRPSHFWLDQCRQYLQLAKTSIDAALAA